MNYQGVPVDKFFKYTRKKAVIIGVTDYSECREKEGKEKFGDLPEAERDVKVVKAGLARLGFFDEDV